MKKLPPFQVLRTVILFFFALAGIAWEIVVEQGERPTLLILLGMMAGLPVFLNVDDRFKPPKDPPFVPPLPPLPQIVPSDSTEEKAE